MNRLSIFLLLAACVLVGGLFYAFGTGAAVVEVPGATARSGAGQLASGGLDPDAARAPTTPSDASQREVVDGSIPGGRGEPAAYRAALSGIRGRLVWETSGDPIPGVELKLAELWLDAAVPKLEDIAGLAELRSPVVFRAQTMTDADGGFHLREVHSRAVLVLAIGLKTDKAAFRVLGRSPARGELLDLGDVRLQERGVVLGKLVDDAGQPVAGARVRIVDIPKIAFQFGAEHVDPRGMVLWVQGPYRVVLQFPKWLREYDEILPFGDGYSGPDGRFRVTGVRPGTPSMWISKSDHAPLQRPVTVGRERETDVGVLTLDEGEFLSGQFVDGEGDPVTSVRVGAGGANGIVPVSFVKQPRPVDGEGRFEIAGLPRNQLYLVYQRRAGLPYEVSGPHGGSEDVKIVLDTLAQGVVSVFEGPTRRPYEGPVGFSVCIADESAFMPGFEQMIPGDRHFQRAAERKHEWHVRDLPQGLYRVVAQAPGYAMQAAILDLSKDAKQRTAELVLTKSPTVRFEVVTEAGDPVEAARVYWNPTKRRSERKRKDFIRLPVLLGKTDAAGVLETTSVPANARAFYARHPGFALAAQRDIVDRRVRLVMGRTGRLSGMVAADGRPPEEPHTVVASPGGSIRREFAGVLVPVFAQTDPDGAFHFENLQPGRWRLRVLPALNAITSPAAMRSIAMSTAARGAPVETDVVAAGDGFVRLELAAPTTVEGAGSIVGTVMVNGASARGAWVQTWAGRRRAEVATDGTFELTGLRDGELWIGVEVPGATGFLPSRLWEGRVRIVEGSQENLQIYVDAAEVVVTVVDESGRAVEGLPVELVGKHREAGGHRGRARLAVTTNAMGRAQFAMVPHGSYVFRSAMQRQARVVVAEAAVEVFRDRVTQQAQAIQPAVARGEVTFDESGLTAAEREYARVRRPTYVVFESDRRFVWGPITAKDGRDRFVLKPGPPGDYTMQRKGALGWTSSVLHIPAGGTDRAHIVLRPDVARLKKAVAGLAERKGAAPKDGQRR